MGHGKPHHIPAGGIMLIQDSRGMGSWAQTNPQAFGARRLDRLGGASALYSRPKAGRMQAASSIRKACSSGVSEVE